MTGTPPQSPPNQPLAEVAAAIEQDDQGEPLVGGVWRQKCVAVMPPFQTCHSIKKEPWHWKPSIQESAVRRCSPEAIERILSLD